MILFMSACFESFSQYSSAIKIHLIKPIRGLYGISFEQALTKKISAELSGEFGQYLSGSFPGHDEYVVRGKGLIGEVRFYPLASHTAPKGYFIAGAFRYVLFDEEYTFMPSDRSWSVGGTIWNAAFATGYKFMFHRVSAELLAGLGIGQITSDDPDYRHFYIPEVYSKPLNDEVHFYRIEITIGYLFNLRKKQNIH
jgi:hypothetical protein